MRHKHRVKSRKFTLLGTLIGLKVKSLGVATLLTFIFFLSTVSAQESINATGGNASGSGGSVSYSIGQVFYQTHTGTNGTVTQGVQQAYIISNETGFDDIHGINLSVSAYPNPTSDYLTLSIDDDVKTMHALSQSHYQLYDMNGKLLQTKELTGTETQIDMSSYVPSTYFVRVVAGHQSVKEFKIIKTQ
jgi:hypothetical protein